MESGQLSACSVVLIAYLGACPQNWTYSVATGRKAEEKEGGRECQREKRERENRRGGRKSKVK